MPTLPVLLVMACVTDDPVPGTEPDVTTPTSTSTPTVVDPTTTTPPPTTGCTSSVVINELQASNVNGIVDADGDSSDWLELYNADAAAVDLGGWWLSDAPDEPQKWPLPGVIVPPGGFLLLFASGKDVGGGVLTWDTKVDVGHEWRYREITGPFDAGWQAPDYDDGWWASGPSGFGRGDDDDATPIAARTLQVRTTVAVSPDELTDLKAVSLHVDYDDGFVAWINGVEVARANLGVIGFEPAWDEFATTDHEAELYQGGMPARFEVDPGVLGELNTLALTVADVSETSSDLSLIPLLSLGYGTRRQGAVSAVLDPPGGELHTNFKLRAEGERVWLFDPDGCQADVVDPGQTWADQSYGRTSDGGAASGYFMEPTPGAPNLTESRPGFAVAPVFSPAGGFYPGGTDVSLAAGPGARLVVAADGYEPHEVDPIYTAPILLDGSAEASVLRARAFQDGLWPSPIVTATYFGRDPGPLPVISLVTDPTNLWDWDTGIYVLGDGAEAAIPHYGANYWQDWERPLHVALWEPDGGAGLDVNAGVEIHGGWTRAHEQKSLKLKLRSGYGDASIAHEVFPGLGIIEFDDLVVRNAGNDWHGCSDSGCSYGAHLRDALMHRITEGADMDRMAYRPTEAYLNGEYWGIHNLRERPGASYVAAHHGVEDIDLLERRGRVVEGDGQHYATMLEIVRGDDLSDPAVYATIAAMMDVDQFADYMIFEIWFDNTDWPGNNIKFWRPRTPDGRWRWLLYDTDFGLGLYWAPVQGDTLALALDANGPSWPNPPWSTELFRLMVTAPQFRTDFVNRYADRLNTQLLPARTQALLSEMAAVIAPIMPRHLDRWGMWTDGMSTQRMWPGDWEGEVGRMYDWLRDRPGWATTHIVDNFGLAGTWTLQLDADPPGAGYFELTAVSVEAPFSGTYFLGVPVTLTAIPAPGYRFVEWSDPAQTASATITVDPAGSTQLTARFQ